MITNDRQFQQTRKKLRDLEALITATKVGDAGDNGFRDLQIAGLKSQAADLGDEISEYGRASGTGSTTSQMFEETT